MKENSQQKCPHCPGGFGLEHPLFKDKFFWIVCDVHPLTKGHVLIIPKEHISCIGVLSKDAFERFKKLYEKVMKFLNETYGYSAVFEHGVTGQTVVHAHTHFLPFNGRISNVVPENKALRKISTLNELKTEFDKNGRYLYIGIGNKKWLVDTSIGYPKFFRERFAKALGNEERGDWKKVEENAKLIKTFEKEIKNLEKKWLDFFNK